MTSKNNTGESRDEPATRGVSRRSVLRTAAATGAAGLAAGGLAGTGAARRTTVEHVGGVGRADIEASLESAGADVLSTLSAEDHLAEASTADLRTDEFVDLGAVASNREGTAVVRNGRGVLQYVTVKHVDGGVLSVSVEPENDRAYAHFQPDGEDARYLYDPDAGLDGVDTQDVGTEADCTCHGLTCSDGSRVEECEHCECGTICGDDGCCCSSNFGCC